MKIKNQELHLRELLLVLKKRRGALVGFFVTVVSLVLLFTFTTTPYYEGSTKIMIEKAESDPLAARTVSRSTDPEFYETQFQLIKSRAVARRVVKTLGLDENPEAFFGKHAGEKSLLDIILPRVKDFLASVRNLFSQKTPNNSEEKDVRSPADKIALAISDEIQVRPVEGSRIVNISFLSPNPELAALIANTTAKAYIEEILEMKLNATRERLDWMTKKAEGEAEKLKKSEQALQEYMKTNNLVMIEDRMTVTPEKLSEINVQLLRAETRRKELQALYSQVRAVRNDYRSAQTISAIAADPALRDIRAAIIETEKTLMELGNKYGPKHPIMVKTRGDLQILHSKRNQEIERIVESIRNEYELALSNEHNLRAQLENTKKEALVLNEKFIQYGHLKRVVDTNRTLYETLLLRLKEQSITEETQPVNFWLVEKASVPLAPAKPLVAINLLMGCAIGVLGGVMLAFFLEYLDNTVKDPEEVEKTFGIPVLGVIELWKSKGQNLENIVIKEPQSRMVESYRGLRTAIQLSFADSHPKKILLTSSAMGEGKTTTAANLALSLAQSNSRVILIEGDLRKPRIHKIFKISNNIGLSNYLAGAGDGHIIQKGPISNMAIIPSGPIPPNPSELLVSNRMKVLLESVSKEFDYVICDTPPLLPVADTRILGRLFDGVILVSKAGQTTYDLVERSLKMLNDIGAKLLGMVINAHDVKTSGYYHQSYYDYYESRETQAESPKS